MENVPSKEIALSSESTPNSQLQKERKKERNTRDGKWKTPIGFCCVFVKQIKHRFSHRRDGGRRLSRGTDRGGRRTPIEQCKLLLKASQLCAAELKSTVHSL